MIIWLMGISGSGKTTLGRRVKKYFDSIGKRSCLIDGDIVRNFYDNDLGYSKEERISNIKRIMLAAHLLEENNVVCIVCNILPFEELRKFARKKMKKYIEIYLKRSLNQCKADDVKNVYKQNMNKTEIVGIDIEFEEPENSDLIIDTENEMEEQSFEKIINHLKNC